ncbi:ribose-phosphate pyrophosphokinase [Catalinimonas alkaloidigena]|uniref:ribose-phosphate diphosphokinase n=1 Tax=Catalinimonas alkaloidigena TaxID=1075417 RepID=UPI0024057CF2|nr:ribose-phosphate pyrophosphokinase [Catalinimonas alkaloidigena]MDF9799623.1 ribose-phosphate pyrophosphokinase [Catalinimonas alkaloidigena]
MKNDIKLFALKPDEDLGGKVAEQLGIALAELEERSFEDGEHKLRALEGVNGKDVYVIHSLYGDLNHSVNDKVVRLIFLLGSLKDAGAKRVTAIIPYLAYARKDRKTKSRDPLNTHYLARMLESVGTDRVLTVDVHNLQAYQNAFRCKNEHLEAQRLFAVYLETKQQRGPVAIMSPDAGGVKRASAFRGLMQEKTGQKIPLIFMEKERSRGEVSGEALVGEVAGRNVIIFDDMISTGTTLSRAAAACKKAGAKSVKAVATHGLFVNTAGELLSAPEIEELIICNTIPPFRLQNTEVSRKLKVLDISPLLADAIQTLSEGGELEMM